MKKSLSNLQYVKASRNKIAKPCTVDEKSQTEQKKETKKDVSK